jgi:hypothetical protein
VIVREGGREREREREGGVDERAGRTDERMDGWMDGRTDGRARFSMKYFQKKHRYSKSDVSGKYRNDKDERQEGSRESKE